MLPIGLTVMESSPDTAYFYFVHRTRSCGSTFVIPSEEFPELEDLVKPDKLLQGTIDCGGHCIDVADTSPCEKNCRNAPFRSFLRKLVDARETATTRVLLDSEPTVPTGTTGQD